MPTGSPEVIKALISTDEQIAKLRARLSTTANQKPFSSRMLAIVKILSDNPILETPCLEFLQTKLAQFAQTQLVLLYGPERAEQMMEAARQQAAAEAEHSEV